MKKYGYILLVGLLSQWSCNTDNRIGQTRALKQEMEGVKIKRVTDAQLVAIVDEWGKEITQASRRALEKELAQKPTEAVSLCADLSKVPLIAAVDRAYGLDIQLVALADVPSLTLHAREREVLDAYIYSAERNLPQSDNVQKLNDTLLVYNAPVPRDSKICQACFENKKMPFAVWRILFDKKVVIQKLDAKQLN